MALRYEAWTPPWDPGGFFRKVAMMPVIEGTGQGSIGFQTFPGDSSVDISLANFDRLSDLVSDTEASLITVFDTDPDGTQTIIDEWILDRIPSRLDETHRASLSGPGLLSFFERVLVYAFDYPASPARQADWLWGSENMLSMPDFENPPITNKIIELQINATGGSYTLHDETDTTSAIAWDADAATIKTRIETDLGGFNEVIVVLAGPGRHIIQMVDPPFGVNLGINVGSLSGGTVPRGTTTTTEQGGYESGSWEPARSLVPGAPSSGAYDFWGISDNEAHGGTFSLQFNGGFVGVSSNRNGGVQHVLNVTPGGLYQASVWVFPTNATPDPRIRFAIFSENEELIAYNAPNGLIYTENDWTQISLNDIVIPDNVTRVIFRVQLTNPAPYNPPPVYVDDAAFYEGLPPTTIGDIWQMLLDDAAVNHASDPRGTPLDWIDYSSFSATLNSNGNPWNEDELTFSARWGSNYTHVLDDTMALGYEVELVRKATPVGSLTHDFHLYNPTGRDDSPTGAGIHTGQPVLGGDAVRRNPSATALLVAGPEGSYTEDTSSALTNFGRMESFIQDSEATSVTSRQLLADNFFSFEEANRNAVRFEIIEAPGVPRPLADYRPGDTIPMTLAPSMPRQMRRVQRVDYVNTTPTQYVVVGSRLLEGEASAFDLVGRMWRRMSRPSKIVVPGSDFRPGGGGFGAPTVVIAASNASELSKGKADFICTGVSDEVLLQEVGDSLPENGMIILTEGVFEFSSTANWILPNGCVVQGAGRVSTIIQGSAGNALISMTTHCRMSDLYIDNFSTLPGAQCVELNAGFSILENCTLHHQGGIAVYVPGAGIVRNCGFGSGATGGEAAILIEGSVSWVDGCYIDTRDAISINSQATTGVLITNNYINNQEQIGINLDTNDALVQGNIVFQNAGSGAQYGILVNSGERVQVVGNSIDINDPNAIGIEAGSQYGLTANNIIRLFDSDQVGIHVLDSNTVIGNEINFLLGGG